MVETEGLTHVHLVVRDVQCSLAFYAAVFGMKVHFWDGDRMVFIGTPGRGDSITLNQSDQSSAPVRKAALTTSASGSSIRRGSMTPSPRFCKLAAPSLSVVSTRQATRSPMLPILTAT